MSRLASGALALLAVFVLGACVSVSVQPTALAAPTGPAATSQAGPGQTVAPVQTQGQQPTGNLCDRVTLPEVSAAAGGLPAVLDDDLAQFCWDIGEPDELGTPAAFVDLRLDFGNALEDGRTLFPDGEDVAVGDDGYWTPSLNTLWFTQNGGTYAVQVVVVRADDIDERAVAIALAMTAAPRL